MITVNVHTGEKGLESLIPVSEISDVLARPHDVLWVDVVDPTPEDLRLLAAEFHFHPLAMEDASRHHQRPKIEIYDDFIFLVFYAFGGFQPEARLRAVEIDVFVGRHYVVTVHDEPVPVLQETSERWNHNTSLIGQQDVAIMLYSILDAIVDSYFPVIDKISDRIEDLEEVVFERFDIATQQEMFRLKRDLLAIRRVVAPERDVMNVLVRRDTPVFDPATLYYFQDIYDHILRVTDAVDTYRDLLSSALDSSLTVTSNRLNQVMKTLTASSIILMTVTLVASIYGMNFERMPELGWRLGYAWALGVMAASAGVLAYIFRRRDYF